ncbi:MAG: tRNA guanosine(34) transglycosylase Tgt [Caldilineaceae bacterium]
MNVASLQLPHGILPLPTFLPDATLGAVRAVDSHDLAQCGVQGLVMNTFHLMQHPGSSTVQALGGLHQMSGWPHPIVTDSGGFQAYSLIRQNAKNGALTKDGILFRPEGAARKFKLTPEKCVQLQMSYGSDVIMCLDDCTHVDDPLAEQQRSVQRTIAWAQRCKAEFARLAAGKSFTEENKRPLLFGVIQGGGARKLRQECAEALLDLGFDGYGYGGWPLDGDNNLVVEMLAYVRSLVPECYALHALGIGHPVHVATCSALGYGMFDSALPTRDARRGRLYTTPLDLSRSTRTILAGSSSWFSFLYIDDKKHIKATEPIMEACDCLTCTTYSRGYLRHLFKSSDTVFMRLATIHNLRFMARLMEALGRP